MTAGYQPARSAKSARPPQTGAGEGTPSSLRCAWFLWLATGHDIAISRREWRPKLFIYDTLSKAEGAGKAGCPRHPQSCARMHMTDRRCAGTPGLPCAMVLTAYAALSPETNSSCLRRWRIGDRSKPGRARRISVSLTPATGAGTTRFCRPQLPSRGAPTGLMCCRPKFPARAFKRRSSARRSIAHKPKLALRTHRAPDAAASTATCPNVRDDGRRPSVWDRMAGVYF